MSGAKKLTEDNPWTEEEVTRLRAFWIEGLTATQIGGILRRSRNSVIGKVHRTDIYQLGPKRPSNTNPAPPKAAKVREPKPEKKQKTVFLPVLTKDMPELPADVWAPLPDTEPVPIMKATGCRWPIGDHLFCNAGKDSGSNYCTHHRAMSTYTFKKAA